MSKQSKTLRNSLLRIGESIGRSVSASFLCFAKFGLSTSTYDCYATTIVFKRSPHLWGDTEGRESLTRPLQKLSSPQVNSRMGFTLVEIMVSAVLASFVFGVIFFLFLSSQRSFDSTRTYLDIYADARLALDWMSKDIKWAPQVLSSWESYTTSTNCLVLEIPSIDATNGDIIAGEYDHLIYQLNSGNLERIMDADDTVPNKGRIDHTKVIANNISSLIFSSGGIDLSSIADFSTVNNIAINLTASKTRLGRVHQETLNSVIKLRNK